MSPASDWSPLQWSDPARRHRPLSILLIEDDVDFQLIVRLELEDEPDLSATVSAVECLGAAVERCRSESFDIILTDIHLPDSQGFETFATLFAAAAHIPIIVFTNHLDEALAVRILRHGAQDYVAKSKLRPGVLPRVIHRAIERQTYASALDVKARELAESEARVRAIYEASADAVVVTDGEGVVRFANPAAGGMFGRSREALLNRHFGLPVVAGATTEVDIRRTDGTVGVAEMHVVNLPWDGRPAHLASLRDVTTRKRAEQRLRESEERFRLLVAHATDYTFTMLDAQGHPTADGGAAGPTFSPFVPGPDEAPAAVDERPAQALLQQARTEGRARAEGWCAGAQGQRIWAEVSLTAIREEGGELKGFALVVHDLTERRAAEEQRLHMEQRLRQAHKLEAIGHLAAGVAHEINTPAQFIAHNLDYVQRTFGRMATLVLRDASGALTDDSPLLACLQNIPPALDDALVGIGRIGRIVQAMKEFAHPGIPGDVPPPADLNRAVENALVVTQHEWRLVAEVETHFDATLQAVPMFSGEFNQVMLNLIVNASHAIAATGAGTKLPMGRIVIRTQRDGEWAEVRIQDSGAGIPAAIRHRVFDPFFTTKEVGKGTGHGLAHAHAVITQRHRGEISFESPPGQGTTFCVRLPLVPPVPPAREIPHE